MKPKDMKEVEKEQWKLREREGVFVVKLIYIETYTILNHKQFFYSQ